jgi:hypothetical protein
LRHPVGRAESNSLFPAADAATDHISCRSHQQNRTRLFNPPTQTANGVPITQTRKTGRFSANQNTLPANHVAGNATGRHQTDDGPLSFCGSTNDHLRTCRLPFDGVAEKRTGYCLRARINTPAQTQTQTPVS